VLQQERVHSQTLLRNRIAGALARPIFRAINPYLRWFRLPVFLSLTNLTWVHEVLHRKNLIDTEIREASSTAIQPPQAPQPELLQSRTFDGSYNDLSQPRISAIGAAFDRNMQPVYRPDRAAYAEQQVSDARAASGAQRRGQSLCSIFAPALLQTLPARRAFRGSE
jgi:hypothetical protein